MNKLFVVLACLVSLSAAGIWDRSSLMGQERMDRLERMDTDRILSMTQDELLRQKFLLDILMHVQQPLVNERLLELGKTLIVDQDRIQGPIDDEMLHIIELCRNQRLLGKQDIYTITDEDHMRQMIGLYRMLVRSRDWDTFQRNACFARIHINGMLFVNSLLLAVRDRQDTRNLIVPAIHEILPQIFYSDSLVRKAQTMDINMLTNQDKQTQKPGLIDLIGLGRRQSLREQQMGMLDRRQMWMPWREMRLEMAMRRTNGEPMRTLLRRDDNLVLPVEQRLQGEGRMSLLAEDVGLNDLVHNLINELLLQEQDVQKDDLRDEQRLGLGRVELRKNLGTIERLMDQRRRTDDDNDDDDDVRRIDSTRMRGTRIDDMDRVLRVGRRRQNKMIDDSDMDTDRWMQRGRIVDGRRIVDQRDDIIQRQKQQRLTRLRGIDRDEERMRGMQELDIDDLPTTTIDDERLLHINRRHLQDTDILGGDRRDMKNQRDMNNQRERFMNIVRGSRVSDGRRTVEIDRDMDMDMDMGMDTRRNKMTREQMLGMRRNTLMRDDMQRQRSKLNVDDERWSLGRREQERSMRKDVMGNDRRPMREDWNMRRDERVMSNENLDDSMLPTTKIDDERLLHVNRRHLNWMTRDIDDDDRQMRGQMMRGKGKDMRQRVGDERRTMWGDREQLRRGTDERQRWMDNDDDAQKWQRTNIDDERNRRGQQMDNDNKLDRFFHMVQGGIRDGRKILQRDDDVSWTMRQRNEDERMLNKNDRRRWGKIDRDDDDDDEEQSIKWEKRRGMEDIGTERWNMGRETDRWNKRQQLKEDRQGLRMDNGIGMKNDRLLMTRRTRMRLNNADKREDEQTTQLHRRVPRSLRTDSTTNERRRNMIDRRSGEQLLHNLQQLMARINLERISLGITDRDTEMLTERGMNNQRLSQEATDERYALRLNEMRLDTRRNRMMLDEIKRIEERLQQVLDQQLRGATLDNQDDVNRVMGEVLMGRVQGAGILQILRELMIQERDIKVDTDMMSTTLRVALLRCPVMQHLLRRIVKIVDLQRQQLGAYERDDIALDGVRINDVAVDQLRTHVELDDADLINLLDQRLTMQRQDQDQVMQKMLVARQQRLNHKSFKINIDLTADRAQRVIIRTMLLPKIDGDDRTLRLEDARLNALHIDATITDLRAGRNTISRRSRDILWTTRDTTPLTEIYRRVMRAIEGQRDMEMEPIVGNNCRLPHRLLLPRGRVEGLPMQLLVLITPLGDDVRNWQQDIRDDNMCTIGMSTKHLDRLPLGFPLDRKIVNEEQLINLPNLHLKDVIIYHDDKVSTNNMW